MEKSRARCRETRHENSYFILNEFAGIERGARAEATRGMRNNHKQNQMSSGDKKIYVFLFPCERLLFVAQRIAAE